jgi:hypothetical protein
MSNRAGEAVVMMPPIGAFITHTLRERLSNHFSAISHISQMQCSCGFLACLSGEKFGGLLSHCSRLWHFPFLSDANQF